MSKTKSVVVPPAVAAEPTPAQSKRAAAKAQVLKLTGKAPEWKGEQNGNKWLEAIRVFEGRPLAEFMAHMEAAPIMTRKGKPDPASGWVRWLTKNGYVALEAPKAE